MLLNSYELRRKPVLWMEVPLTAELLLYQLVCLRVNVADLHYFGRYRTHVLLPKFLFTSAGILNRFTSLNDCNSGKIQKLPIWS